MNTKIAQERFLKCCPYCGSELIQKDSFDKFIISWSCKQGHEWYTDLVKLSASDCFRGLSFQVDRDDPIQLIKYWITMPELRRYLHPQTAEAFRAIIRKIEEPGFGKRNAERYHYKFCISCGAEVKPIPPDDWDNPYVCTNRHHQSTRNGRYYRFIKDLEFPEGVHIEIQWELPPDDGYKWLEYLSKPIRGGLFMLAIKPSTSVPKQIVDRLPQIREVIKRMPPCEEKVPARGT